MSSKSTESNSFAFPLEPEKYARCPLPSLDEWRTLWSAWDLVTTKMIPENALMEKPIPLRNPLLFYLGHIPAFEDIHLTRATNGKPTKPAEYHVWFERGIDPDVDDPTQCHAHSEMPKVWPKVEEILAYREKVKKRITALYDDRQSMEDRCIKRAIWIGYEHEALHVETFLFMTIQSPNVLPPPGSKPDFQALAEKSLSGRVENQWFEIPPQTFTIGWDDPEDDSGPDRFFAWDNEREPYSVSERQFDAQGRPVCNGEYVAYLVATNSKTIPSTWTKNPDPSSVDTRTFLKGLVRHSDRDDDACKHFIDRHAIRTVYGPVPLALALDWPLMSSYNEADGYAKWVKARIPTLHEVRSIHEYAEGRKAGRQPGVKRMPKLHPEPTEIFVDLTGCNAGFQQWHPRSVTANGNRVCGLGDMGGAAEWTSTFFAPQPNFKPMDIYPGYSADFMDGKHKAVVGGSWALPPRISGRKTFLNWWQLNYVYPWVTVRLVRDRHTS